EPEPLRGRLGRRSRCLDEGGSRAAERGADQDPRRGHSRAEAHRPGARREQIRPRGDREPGGQLRGRRVSAGFSNALRVEELKKRLLFTAGMLAVYRIGVAIPTPGIDGKAMQAFFEEAANNVFGLVNLFSGGAL